MATASLIVAMSVLAGCARPGTHPGAAPTVPPGCHVDQATVTWSDITEKPILTTVRVQPSYRSDPEASRPSWTPPSATVVRDEPFVPAVRGRAVPPTWLPILAGSLQTASGRRVHTEKTRPELGKQLGVITMGDRDTWLAHVFYAGVQQISAAFTVACSPPLPGSFLAWTTSSAGNVSCDLANPAPGPMGLLALRYCPDPVTPRPSR